MRGNNKRKKNKMQEENNREKIFQKLDLKNILKQTQLNNRHIEKGSKYILIKSKSLERMKERNNVSSFPSSEREKKMFHQGFRNF